ncbi:MAG: transketolase [Alphaproteobacteria bacterium]|nr:transketolase [Alphaproteobacteria bacterium]MBU0798483.1 transketolase [Alphaproteobacteria bacterium]MBU0886728.1 transketolase [Alphaproteobacteria bacterium]MBU1812544.1 transketolase [Alphaproteobacteria bacterium]
MTAQNAPTIAHDRMANAIRALSMDAVEAANSGHPGMPMGMADVATVLYTKFLKFDAAHPDWADRDRFILSAGHGSMLLYSLLYLTGYPEMTIEQIRNFRQLGAITAGHPEYGHAPGIETTTGPLGQGIATSVGFALGERILNARFGDDLVDHFTYVVAGDGCLMEGISQEAITLAGHLKLGKLIVLFDDNGISIDGPVSLSTSEDQLGRFKAAGWDVQAIDGHDPKAIESAIAKARASDTPSLIACKTIIGYGAPKKQGSSSTHGSPLGAEEIAGARARLGWDFPPFEIPEDVLGAWRAAGKRGETARLTWQERLDDSGSDTQEELERVLSGALPSGFDQAVEAFKKAIVEEKPKIATRMSSQRVIDALAPVLPELIGGSADLTGSNNTKAKEAAIIKAGDYRGSYIHYGIREHGMAAAMNGLALHGGIIPFGGTFMVFTDYCRPAIRLSALMGLRVIYIMTHDSIGLGEDGPTHQPVEHMAALRAIPNLYVFRPADTVETAEAWQIALQSTGTPSVISLTRQALPALRTSHAAENLSAKGGYVLAEAEGTRHVTLIGTGSEVSLAMDAREKLKAEGINAAVVSMPCWELFDAQPEAYRQQVLGSCPRIAVEAAIGFGWERYIGTEGAFIGMTGFGASAPAPELYKHFGITAEAVVAAAKARI